MLQIGDPDLIRWFVEPGPGLGRRGRSGRRTRSGSWPRLRPTSATWPTARDRVRWFPALVGEPRRGPRQPLPPRGPARGADPLRPGSGRLRLPAPRRGRLVERRVRHRRDRRPVLRHRLGRRPRRASSRRLADAGVDQFNVYLMNGDEEEQLEIYGREIIPALRAAAPPTADRERGRRCAPSSRTGRSSRPTARTTPTSSSTARGSPSIGRRPGRAGVTADETIDAAGRYVIPGAIDVHTHMELPFGGTFAKDTFETGTRAAAFGGTTTIVDFAVQSRGKSLREGLDAWHGQGRGQRRRRLRLPHDHERRQRRDARRDGPAGRRGRPGLQAVHRLPGRLLQRRRGHLPGAAADRPERRPDHDARRERAGHRRGRGRRGRGRPHRPLLPRDRPLPDLRGRGHRTG